MSGTLPAVYHRIIASIRNLLDLIYSMADARDLTKRLPEGFKFAAIYADTLDDLRGLYMAQINPCGFHRCFKLGVVLLPILCVLGCHVDKKKATEAKIEGSPASEHTHPTGVSALGTPNEGSKAQYGLVPIRDESGAQTKLQDFLGKPLIVFFGYASCSSICPTSLGYLAQELDLLGEDRKRVVPIFISIDAKGDSTEKVREFVRQFASDIRGFTGSQESIRQLIDAFKPLGNYVPPTDPSLTHTMSHFRSFLLVDPKGQITGMFAPPFKREALAKFIATHLNWYQAEETTP